MVTFYIKMFCIKTIINGSEPKEDILTIFNIYKMLTKWTNINNMMPFVVLFVLEGFSLDFLDLNPK